MYSTGIYVGLRVKPMKVLWGPSKCYSGTWTLRVTVCLSMSVSVGSGSRFRCAACCCSTCYSLMYALLEAFRFVDWNVNFLMNNKPRPVIRTTSTELMWATVRVAGWRLNSPV